MDPHMYKLPDGKYADGSWELNIYVTNLQQEKQIRVTGDLHIGGVMLKLVESLDLKEQRDWSDHAIWWPDRNQWLKRTGSTLDQCHVQADAKLQFTPMHKTLRVQMPDMQLIDMRVDFSSDVLSSVIELCKEVGIRHPEELSFLKKPDAGALHVKQRSNGRKKKDRDRDSMASSNSNEAASTGSLDGIPPHTPTRRPSPGFNRMTPNSTPGHNGNTTLYSVHSSGSGNFSDSIENLNMSLMNSPQVPSKEAREGLVKPNNFREKALINCGWLDSSKSLMEQGTRENDTLMMRFKYFAFYDLDPKQDAVRINQIFEQAKWGLLNEEIDCTDEEMIMFAALQMQVNLQAQMPQPDPDAVPEGQDDIDKALTNLQVSLEGTSITTGHSDITTVPELCDNLRFFRPKKLTLKSYKRGYFVFRDTHLTQYKAQEDNHGAPVQTLNLNGCEVTHEVSIQHDRYGIKLLAKTPEAPVEMWLRCESEEQYAKWMAACRLASKGKTMADSSYQSEVQGIQAFLGMQRSKKNPNVTVHTENINIQTEDYVSPTFLKKHKSKQVASRILDAHTSVRNMKLMDAKCNYIKAWQALPEYGVTYFVVKFRNSKKEELIGVAYNRLIKMDINSGDSQKTWRYSTMTAWHVNWEVKEVLVQMEDENIQFSCSSADCKVVHEFIGGYIFLSMRSLDSNQTLNKEMFHKLTGGWV
ncbi:fermitin family homolog 2-like [Asterias rubens]|uniref:fermitin family homolog 2-like n=1 Tax=Asterias rubens TaxID=7604 RepID=UPI001455B2CF|nr:fermitin family homolog 2-like [Asterias rubens]